MVSWFEAGWETKIYSLLPRNCAIVTVSVLGPWTHLKQQILQKCIKVLQDGDLISCTLYWHHWPVMMMTSQTLQDSPGGKCIIGHQLWCSLINTISEWKLFFRFFIDHSCLLTYAKRLPFKACCRKTYCTFHAGKTCDPKEIICSWCSFCCNEKTVYWSLDVIDPVSFIKDS